jgi:hypothetical protein
MALLWQLGPNSVFWHLNGMAHTTNNISTVHFMRISFTTDYYPGDNRWTLHIGNETIQSQPFDEQRMTFVNETCVPADVCIKFRVFLQDPGGYSVMLDGEEVANGDDFSYGESKYITGNCDCPAGLSLLSIMAHFYWRFTTMEWALSHQKSTSAEEYIFIHTMDHDREIFEECIPEGCWHLTNPQCHDRAYATVYNEYDEDVQLFSWVFRVRVTPSLMLQ